MYHQGNQSVFVGDRLWTLLPPPANDIEEWFKHYGNENHYLSKTGSFTSLQMFHTHASLPQSFFQFTRNECYYPFPEAELASKYREELSNELILELTGLHQVMSPCVVLGLSKFL